MTDEAKGRSMTDHNEVPEAARDAARDAIWAVLCPSVRSTPDDLAVYGYAARMALQAALPHLAPQPPTEPTRAEAAQVEPLTIIYTNWRGETSERRILPVRMWYGATDWHPEPQWLLKAIDVEKNAERDFAWSGIDFQGNGPARAEDAPHVEPGGEREKHLRLETVGENLARDMAEGRFPARSEPRMRPDIDSAWDAIAADPLLSEARRKLSANEIKQIIAYAESFALRSSRDAVLEEAAKVALTAGPQHYATTHPGHQRSPSEIEGFIASQIHALKVQS